MTRTATSAESPPVDRLFVYGSLKRGARHHAELRGARFVGEARTEAGYGLESLGEYLALVERPGAGSVSGELFEVTAELLDLLDEFEGEAYRRARVRVWSDGAATVGKASTNEGARGREEPCLALAYLKRTR